ncbi:hypothetical protein [Kibdelosporangium philippinense]|uniref:hypothetical protein n=1 Tax=Kibdelosporangium philippinense TaxID=211113 RepID=UPI003614A429
MRTCAFPHNPCPPGNFPVQRYFLIGSGIGQGHWAHSVTLLPGVGESIVAAATLSDFLALQGFPAERRSVRKCESGPVG